MNSNVEGQNVNVLFEHVFCEEKSEKFGSRRFLVRVLEFRDSHTLTVGFSRQWLAPDGKWIAAKKGHAYFPIKVWNDLSECFGELSGQIKTLFANGSNNVAGRMGSNACGSHVGGSYAPNAGTISGGDDADVATDASASGGEANSEGVEAQSAKTSFSSIKSNKVFGAAPFFGTYKRGAGSNGNVYHRGGAKRAYGQ